MSQVVPQLVQDVSKLRKLASEKKRFSVRKKPVDAKLAPNLHLKGPGASPRGWDMRMLRQQGRSKSMCFTYTSTHLTFIIENANSPNFYQRTGVLRMHKWPPRPSKMIPKSTPKATTNDPQKILSAHAFQPPASEICLCRSRTRSVRRRCPRLRVQYMYTRRTDGGLKPPSVLDHSDPC